MDIHEIVHASLREDLGDAGDVTTDAIVDADTRCRVQLIAKQDGVLSGIDCFRTAMDLMHADVANWTSKSDGDAFTNGDILVSFEGLAGGVLKAERVALNFLQRLSGVATMTAAYVAAAGSCICDTRKTTPLMRSLEKRAVLHGGGRNHRFGLSDGVLIKDNHIAAAGGIAQAVARARDSVHHLLKIEVEVTTAIELDEALEAGVDAVLLDNMSVDEMRDAVARAKTFDVILEASGNMDAARAAEAAAAGVHRVSVGALTHSAPSIDLSLAIEGV